MPLPSKSEIIRQDANPYEKRSTVADAPAGKHDPVIEKPSKAFSIKDLFQKISNQLESLRKKPDDSETVNQVLIKEEFSPEAFERAWNEFTEQLKGEGTRIVSMFKSIKPEFENDQTIKIHLSNAAQKDTFVLNYKQRLITFLENRFNITGY